MPNDPSALPEIGPYRPLSRRRRLLIVGLAVATAVGVVVLLLDPPGGVQRTRPAAVAPTACAPGQTDGCVGGTSAVIAPAEPTGPAESSAPAAPAGSR